MILKYARLITDARPPTKEKDPTDAGFDLYSASPVGIVLAAGERRLVGTGLSLWWEPTPIQAALMSQGGLGWYGRLAEKSGLANRAGLSVLGGVIDSGYRGEVKVVLLNTADRELLIEPYGVICQIIPTVIWAVATAGEGVIGETVRGASGFGS